MSFSKEGSDSTIYGVDYGGKVWALQNTGSHPVWTVLPNPTKINIKRLVSFSNILWGIGHDHQIYVYVPKRDLPIRVRVEIWENQRWNPVEGFTGTHLLPTDRTPFSSEDGTEAREKSDKLPSNAWSWEGDWQIENTFENELVAEGWTYAIDFPANYHSEKTFKSFVRRRKLFRYRKFIGTNRWNRIEALHQDHTQEPFIDVGVGGLNSLSSPETCCLWAVSILGEVYFRHNTTVTNPEGSNWKHIPIRKGLEACQLTVGNGVPFIVTWNGSFVYRIGITPKTPFGSDWLESSGPAGGLMQLSAGRTCLWAITRDKKCFALKGNWPDIVVQSEPAFEWIELPGRMKSIAVGKTDDIVLALSDEELSSMFLRTGISEEQKYGQCWKPVFKDADWDSMSVVSSVSEDAADSGRADSAESLVSLKPDMPAMSFNQSSGDTGGAVPNSFCWVDGASASCFRTGVDNDLEVGVWREEILQDLQKLKLQRTSFSSYPDALEPSSVSWSKSARVKFLHLSRNSRWLDGHLEVSNNLHLIFHENLEKAWLCAVSDVLSVLGGIGGANTISCRIRNSLEPGVAEFVTFKFMNEKDTEEWRETITELAVHPLDDFSIAGIWLITPDAEIHRAGLVRILEGPVEAEVVTSESGGDQFHYPLVRGFLPDSLVHLDITIPSGAQMFSINLKGKTDATTAFHFNPRFQAVCVVRNSCENGEWGEEERDGVFPFRENMSYTISIQSTQTHILTTVIQKKTKFIFSFKHRVPPKCISNLFVYGNVNVIAVRYDPKIGENYDLEFATQAIPGHFWKVEAGANGSVWALGYDLKVWCFTGNCKQQKTEGTPLNAVTDEHTYYSYENQRWNPVSGFSSNVALPTDRHGWTDETGRISMDKDDVKLPSNRWTWASDWELDYETPSGVDDKGWQYAVDFPASYHPNKRINDFVRRRRWKRVSKLTIVGPWLNAPGMKLVDLTIRMNEDCEWEVLGLQENGDAVVRCGITPENTLGTGWESLSSEKPLVSISAWFAQRIWGVGKDGFAYIRYGNTWQILDRPRDTPLKTVAAGSSSIWAIGTNKTLYRRTEVQTVFPEGREWIRVCDGVLQVGVAPDGNVWALLKSDNAYGCTLAKRMGISLNNPGGLGWEMIAIGPWRQFSVAGCFSRNK